ncbi:hypothetical protein PPL_02911 [Heterostelium album PN500]|uniref:Uncharacterized protein n=1 Tax=Heterostelium pallidum (strain ATCC 26659 / Pp 5 / PN500) TaxID=670386 RepID=D3B3E4_HETP5|nr:hypothetical protein PPL_02911 [Heterostelium album PN500]EFA83842.1 hypothetical protein PPL_02911 [Heterostelium album PN500]|eukprot:XP_020435959.1 hypothetical protein PPL_02911 [Heterostelium album PN500]
MYKISVILLVLVFVAYSTASSIELCAPCSGGKVQSCGSSGSVKCVTIPLGKCYTFANVCSGAPNILAYYIESIDRGAVSGLVYPSMEACSKKMAGIVISEDCGDCNLGTTLTCNVGNSASNNMKTFAMGAASVVLAAPFLL